jgi:hypothetical protein
MFCPGLHYFISQVVLDYVAWTAPNPPSPIRAARRPAAIDLLHSLESTTHRLSVFHLRQ